MPPASIKHDFELTQDEAEHATTIFNHIDSDGSGNIDPEEFFQMRDKDRQDLYQWDLNHDGKIDKSEWLQFLTARKSRLARGAATWDDMPDFLEALAEGVGRCSSRRQEGDKVERVKAFKAFQLESRAPLSRSSLRAAEPRRAAALEGIVHDESELVCRMLGSVNGRSEFSVSSRLQFGSDGCLTLNAE